MAALLGLRRCTNVLPDTDFPGKLLCAVHVQDWRVRRLAVGLWLLAAALDVPQNGFKGGEKVLDGLNGPRAPMQRRRGATAEHAEPRRTGGRPATAARHRAFAAVACCPFGSML